MKRIALFFALLFALPLAAETIEGAVKADGFPLPGATVTLAGATVASRTTITNPNGQYEFKAVTPGSYTLRFELEGFVSVTSSVTVGAGTAARVDAILRVAAIAETITVTASAPQMLETMAIAANFTRGGNDIGISFGRTQYRKFDDLQFARTREQPITTFSIDVDRASYANVRRFLAANELPPEGAVRVEEMINYFTYDYPQPSGDAPFSITTEVSGCPWKPGHRLLRVGIQGRNLDEWRMAPNNLVFLVDVSGSMSDDARLPLIQSAFRLLVDRLRAEDRVAIVVYAGAAGLILPPTSGADKKAILAAIDGLEAGGSTAGGEGIELAYKIAQENFLTHGNNRVILATDGDFNVGISDIDELQTFIEEKRKSGVFLTTIGVGDDNYHDGTLEMLADKGNGNYAYLDGPNEAKKVFVTELTGTLVTIAKDVKVQLAFNPLYVASYRQIGYENRQLANADFDDDTKDAGELGAGHSVTALFEIEPTTGARGEIATVKLRYKEPDGETSRLLVVNARDGGKSAYEATPDMQLASAIAELGMMLRNAKDLPIKSWDDILELARVAQGADLDGHRKELIEMVERARRLRTDESVFILDASVVGT